MEYIRQTIRIINIHYKMLLVILFLPNIRIWGIAGNSPSFISLFYFIFRREDGIIQFTPNHFIAPEKSRININKLPKKAL